jgi:hypothetical protein
MPHELAWGTARIAFILHSAVVNKIGIFPSVVGPEFTGMQAPGMSQSSACKLLKSVVL